MSDAKPAPPASDDPDPHDGGASPKDLDARSSNIRSDDLLDILRQIDPSDYDQGGASHTGDERSSNILSAELLDFLCRIGPSAYDPVAVNPEVRLIGACGGCGRDLPWPSPKAGCWASPVPCPECGRWYFTERHNDAAPELADHETDGAIRRFSRAEFTPCRQAESIFGLLDKLVAKDAYLGPERRRHTRVNCSQPVLVVPMDSNARPIGEAEDQTLCDISQSGAKLLGASVSEAKLLLLDFSPCGFPGNQLLARVVWRQTKEGYTRTGCEFLHQPGKSLPLK